MTYLPKFLYIFRYTLVTIPNAFFTKLDQIITSFTWAHVARIKLQLPLSDGGLALPCFKKYYWAAVLVTVRWWIAQDHNNPVVDLEAVILGSYSELSNLLYRGPKYSSQVTVPMKTTIAVRRKVWCTLVTLVLFPPILRCGAILYRLTSAPSRIRRSGLDTESGFCSILCLMDISFPLCR